MVFCFFSSRRRHTRYWRDWSSDVCSSDLRSRIRLVTRQMPTVTSQAMRVRRVIRRAIVADGDDGPAHTRARADRKSVVQGKSVDLGGRRIIKKKKNEKATCLLRLIILYIS